MMSKKSPVSRTVSTRSIPDLPNTEKEEDLTESTDVAPVKDPSKVKSEERANNAREYEFYRNYAYLFLVRICALKSYCMMLSMLLCMTLCMT